MCLLLSSTLQAHESRPAYLELKEQLDTNWSYLWKIPRLGDMVLKLEPVLPEACVDVVPPSAQALPGSAVERRTLNCGDQGLRGQTIRVSGLESTITDVLVRVNLADGTTQTVILKPERPSLVVAEAQSAWQVAGSYTVLGIEHILLGIDHLLFVLGLMLIVTGVVPLVKTITSFTLAHSITLGVATLGFVHMPQAPVEAVIALSILFLASELARREGGGPGLTERRPWLVAFCFGLLHGFGFAGALSEVGLPQAEIPLALLSFNIGVEIGQLLFVAVVLIAVRLIRPIPWPAWSRMIPVYAIGSVAAFWCIQRVAGFWQG